MSTPSTMAITFSRFLELPTELRLLVWKYAIRPNPGVHFFTVTNRFFDGFALDPISVTDSYTSGDQHILAAPRCRSNDFVYSWVGDNHSAYLWDSGLWTACRESRATIDDHYKFSNTAAKRKAVALKEATDQVYVPVEGIVTNSFVHNNEPQRFSIDPYNDLVCLDPYNPDTINWGVDRHGSHVVGDMKMVNAGSLGAGFLNVAMEFNPVTWPVISECDDIFSMAAQSGPRGTFMRALEYLTEGSFYRPKKLWLIDHSVHPLPNYESLWGMEPRDRFHGLDRAYVEVEREVCRATHGRSTAFDLYDFLAQFFEDELRERRHLANTGWMMGECEECAANGCKGDDFRLHDVFGVLAPVRPQWLVK
ncbi:hypothetical protein PT974_10999 [Cladobotryum mycophilum]|uniref:2EXR domain-containing protein n=1 Tax=Cladobotryum mycophilum TaxID=491253 RepID=A0ABR0SCB9_9HYPO